MLKFVPEEETLKFYVDLYRTLKNPRTISSLKKSQGTISKMNFDYKSLSTINLTPNLSYLVCTLILEPLIVLQLSFEGTINCIISNH